MSGAGETLKHAAIYAAAGMLGKLVGFIMLPFYAHRLGAEGYGVIGMMEASIALLTGLLAYGGVGAITRVYHEQPPGREAIAVTTGFWIVAGTTAVLVAITFAASAPLASLLFGDEHLAAVLCLASLSFMLDMCGQTANAALIIRRRSVAVSMIGLLRLFCGLSLNILLIVVLDLGVLGYFLSSAITSLVSYAVSQRICFRDCGYAYDSSVAREIIGIQAPLIPSALVSFASRQSERVILRFMESIEKVGVLEMGYKFPSLLQLLIQAPLMQSWNTERTRMAQRQEPAAARRIGDMFTLSLYLMTCGGLIIALCIEDVLVLLTPEEFWGASRIAQIECLTIIVASATYHCNFGYLFQKDSKSWAMLTSSTSVLKIALSFGFISWLGIMGAAYSALVAAVLLLCLSYLGGQKRYAIEYRHGANVAICSLAAVIFVGTEFCAELIMGMARSIALALTDLDMLGAGGRLGSALHEKMPYAVDAVVRLIIGSGMIVLLPWSHPSSMGWIRRKILRRGFRDGSV